MQIIEITTDYIKMDQLIKFAGMVQNGSDAKFMIADGLVHVNGELCTQRGKKIRNNDIIEIKDCESLEVKGPKS